MHEGKLLKEIIETRRLKKKLAAEKLNISPQLLQGYFRSERLQDTTKLEIKEKLGIDIESSKQHQMNEPGQDYTHAEHSILSLKKEIEYLKELLSIQEKRIKEKDEVISILKTQNDRLLN